MLKSKSFVPPMSIFLPPFYKKYYMQMICNCQAVEEVIEGAWDRVKKRLVPLYAGGSS